MTMWQNFLAAFALMLVFEGMMPFLSPDRWRGYIRSLLQQPDKTLRTMGFVCMMIGLVILTILHTFAY